MLTPCRRSSRLRTPVQVNKNPPCILCVQPPLTLNQTGNLAPIRPLSSLAERDESPTDGVQSNLDAILSSPLAPRTPATAGRIQPTAEDMHPSKAQQSTTQAPDSGLRLGFIDIDAKGANLPSGTKQATPSKSSAFDFRFARPGPQLGPEAQRLMDDLREEAMRIKANLAAEREEEKRNSGEDTLGAIGGRKIAQPKGKVGRFSDVHMAQFKKMDSIAGHPSSFRAQPGRFPPPPTNNLKRTQSKAQLDERDDTQIEKSTDHQPERLENTAPAKRVRQTIADDISSARPISRDGIHKTTAPAIPRSQSNLLSSITTPTKASLARAASAKQANTQIPKLSRTPSRPNLAATPQRLTKSVTTNSIFSSLPKSESSNVLRSPGKLDRVKAMLRHPSTSLRKPTSIPTFSRSPSRPNLDKALPVVPTTPIGVQSSKSVQHVGFSPVLAKSGIPRSTSKINFGRKIAQPKLSKVHYPSLADHPSLPRQAQEVNYPSLNSPRPLPHPPRASVVQRPPPSVPGTFSFRSDHTINFGASPNGFGSSPGQASVRQVRPSILPRTIPGSFPINNKENIETMPSVPHGIANKKRRRADSDGEEEAEAERSPKKQKAVAEGADLMAPKLLAAKAAQKSQVASPAKKKVLSLSRLNMLARPKNRQ